MTDLKGRDFFKKLFLLWSNVWYVNCIILYRTQKKIQNCPESFMTIYILKTWLFFSDIRHVFLFYFFIMTSLFGVSVFHFCVFVVILSKCIKSFEGRHSFNPTFTNPSNAFSHTSLLFLHLLNMHCKDIHNIKGTLCHYKCVIWNYFSLQWSEDVALFVFFIFYMLPFRAQVSCLRKGNMSVQ